MHRSTVTRSLPLLILLRIFRVVVRIQTPFPSPLPLHSQDLSCRRPGTIPSTLLLSHVLPLLPLPFPFPGSFVSPSGYKPPSCSPCLPLPLLSQYILCRRKLAYIIIINWLTCEIFSPNAILARTHSVPFSFVSMIKTWPFLVLLIKTQS